MVEVYIIQGIVGGIVVGLIYALVASGFSLIFGVAKILWLAHGQLYMLGAVFGVFLVQKLGVPYFLSVIVVMVITGAIGVAGDRLLRLVRFEQLPSVILSLAAAMLIAQSAIISFQRKPTGILFPIHGTLQLPGIGLTIEKLIIMALAAAVILALYFFTQRTKAGQATRAVAQDEEAATLQGINPNRSRLIVFVYACAAAGAAGILVAPLYFVDPFLGDTALMKTFIVVILGGLGSLPGALVGGLILGFIESFGFMFIGGIAQLFGFVLIILVLIIKPLGLLGRE